MAGKTAYAELIRVSSAIGDTSPQSTTAATILGARYAIEKLSGGRWVNVAAADCLPLVYHTRQYAELMAKGYGDVLGAGNVRVRDITPPALEERPLGWAEFNALPEAEQRAYWKGLMAAWGDNYEAERADDFRFDHSAERLEMWEGGE
jgi:hypothetical protein